MNESLLPQLQITPHHVYHLPSNLRSRLLNFLNRWASYEELLACLDALDMNHLVSIQDLRVQTLQGLDRAT